MTRHQLALANFLTPLATVHGCYLLAAINGHVPLCLPYLDSCSSISAAGRAMPEYLLFKLGMLSAAVTKIGFWRLSRTWLRYLGDGPSVTGNILPRLGLVAAVSLMLYTLALGHQGDSYQLTRRTGVALYFGLTFIAQCLLTLRLRAVARSAPMAVQPQLLRVITGLLLIVLSVGIGMVLLDIAPAYKERLENAMEWQMALLMMLVYGLLCRAWRLSGF